MSKFKIQVEIEVDVPDNGALGMDAKQWADKIALDYLIMAKTYRSIGAEDGMVVSVKKVKE